MRYAQCWLLLQHGGEINGPGKLCSGVVGAKLVLAYSIFAEEVYEAEQAVNESTYGPQHPADKYGKRAQYLVLFFRKLLQCIVHGIAVRDDTAEPVEHPSHAVSGYAG